MASCATKISQSENVPLPPYSESHLIRVLSLIALAILCSPPLGIVLFGTAIHICTKRQDHLPKRFLHELAITDLLVRNKLFPTRYPYWSQITTQLFLGGMPLEQHISLLKELKITQVIAIQEMWEVQLVTPMGRPASAEQFKTEGISYVLFSCPDLTTMAISDLRRAVKKIEENIAGNTLVNCRAGRERSAVVVSAFLMKLNRCPAELAIAYVKKIRKVLDVREPRVKLLKQYGETLRD